jgi:hypothetical protein
MSKLILSIFDKNLKPGEEKSFSYSNEHEKLVAEANLKLSNFWGSVHNESFFVSNNLYVII